MPSKSLRAVRTTPERSTRGGVAAVSRSASTVRAPLGCSISSRGPVTRASDAPTAPGARTAVPTLTPPSTPIEVWTRTGMKVRAAIVPPWRGGATSETLGTVAEPTSPRPIAAPAARRSAVICESKSEEASSSAGDS